ncbi:MAG: response regulator [Desulfobulbaceae bacterium]|nr:MAG: response regulator [Desulfobulbaceae bacterium]
MVALPTIKSIRWRLVAAFALVTLLAVSSAIITWYLMDQSESQTDVILDSTIPFISQSQALGREITLFTVASRDLPRLTSKDQHRRLMVQLRARLERINGLVKELEILGVEREFLPGLRASIVPLGENLIHQSSLVDEYLAEQARLNGALQDLALRQGEFNRIIRPRMASSYQDFLEEGTQIENNVTTVLKADDITADSNRLVTMFRVGFDTLITTAAGEIRANHEVIAATMQCAGLLYQAASVDEIDQVEGLRTTYEQLLPALKKLQLILANTTPENSRVVLSALPIFNLGKGDNSIFKLRIDELKAREKVEKYSAQTIEFAEVFSEQVKYLSAAGTKVSLVESERLSRTIYQAQLLQIIAVIVAITIGVLIGWFYVGKQLVGRITSLKAAMDQHAMGIESEIPMKGNDELTEMANALQCFVYQRKTVESALRQSLDFLNEAQQVAKFGSCVIDREKDIWEFSDGFFGMLGYKPDERSSSSKTFFKLISPQDRDRMQSMLQKLTPDSRVFQTEISMNAKDGETHTVLTRWKHTADGRPENDVILGTLLDITERQRMEEELHKVKKLESVGVLAGGIAHDFNNLLTVVLGNLSLALRELPEDHRVYELLKLSESGTLRTKDLTKRLLTFAKGGEPVKAAADLTELLEETAAFVMHGSKSKYRIEMCDELWPVDIDIGQMGQVLQNIIVNGDQAMPDGGEITITSENVTLGVDDHAYLQSGNYVRIALSDQGCGISADHLKSIFDPYFTTKTLDSNKGSGLGLAIVHSIIRKHGGAVDVTSKVGEGTTFTLYIPALPQSEVAEAEDPSPTQASSAHILVMDDEEMVRNVCKSMLEHCGYEVSISSDGEEAVRMYRELDQKGKKPDVVLVDLTVPGGMGGDQAANEILDYDRQARIIVSSGYSNDHIMENYQEYGFCGMTSKPYQINDLVNVITASLVS